MAVVPDSETAAALHFTSRQIFFELAMHHHHYIMARELRNRELPGQSEAKRAAYLKLVISQNYAMLVITLCKVMEFHRAFREYIPDSMRGELDAINSRIARSRILEYRNKFVGHLFDLRTRKPLDPNVIMNYWEALLEGQAEEDFRRWWWSTIHEPELTSVAGLMVRIADSYER